ncbi:MAG: helix-turn-helix domain-containing protein [Nanoarchaeota archaeon]
MEILEERTEKMVEAIEDGRIVSVTENYAKRENLPILKRETIKEIKNFGDPKVGKVPTSMMGKGKEHPLEYLKKPMNWKEKQVLSELIENFHWHIRTERRKKGVTRKQLSKMIGESEESIEKIEFGVLPSTDFVLINKIQQALSINLRKDGKDFSKSVSQMIPKDSKKQGENEKFKHISSNREIEILDDLS